YVRVPTELASLRDQGHPPALCPEQPICSRLRKRSKGGVRMSTSHSAAIAAPQPATEGLLSKERIVAKPGFNRWLVPPAALAIHLCIGMAYGFSVFWLPLSKAVGIEQPLECPADMGFFARMVATGCDWKVSALGWMYTLFFVLLGCSAALWGGW